LKNEDKNNGKSKNNETGQTAQSQKYSAPQEPVSSIIAGCKVSWDYGTKGGSVDRKLKIIGI